MMTKEEFCNQVCHLLMQQLGKKYESFFRIELVGENKLYILSITGNDDTEYPEVYLNSYYQQYEHSVAMETIIKEILDLYTNSIMPIELEVMHATTWVLAAPRIVCRMINTKIHEKEMEEIPHRNWLDLSVIYMVEGDEDPNYPVTMQITNRHMAWWHITEDDLWDAAMKNMPIKYPMQVINMAEAFKEMIAEGADGAYDPEIVSMEIDKLTQYSFYEITNQFEYYGASTILYTNVLSDLADRVEADLLLLPANMHEWIVLPKAGNENYRELSKLINSMQLDLDIEEAEELSKHIYLYNRLFGTIKIVY